jgi:hypothetical protein
VAGQRLDAEIGLRNHVDIADAAVDHQPFPAIFGRFFRQHVTQQGPTQRTAAIDHQHFALSVELDLFLDQRVVLETFDGDDFTTERIAATEIAEHWIDDLDQLRVGVAQIGGEVMHG